MYRWVCKQLYAHVLALSKDFLNTYCVYFCVFPPEILNWTTCCLTQMVTWRSLTLDCVKKVISLTFLSLPPLLLIVLDIVRSICQSCFCLFPRYGFRGPDQYVLWDSWVSGSRGSDRHVVHAGRGLVGTRSAYIWDVGGRGEKFEHFYLNCLKRSYSFGICPIWNCLSSLRFQVMMKKRFLTALWMMKFVIHGSSPQRPLASWGG